MIVIYCLFLLFWLLSDSPLVKWFWMRFFFWDFFGNVFRDWMFASKKRNMRNFNAINISIWRLKIVQKGHHRKVANVQNSQIFWIFCEKISQFKEIKILPSGNDKRKKFIVTERDIRDRRRWKLKRFKWVSVWWLYERNETNCII